MAIQFDGTNDYLRATSAPVTAVPLSMSFWFNPDATSNSDRNGLAVATGSDNNRFNIYLANDNIVRAQTRSSTANNAAAATASFSAGSWQHAAGVYVTSTERYAYYNGGNKGTNTTDITPSGIDITAVGEFGNSATPPTGPWDGGLAEMAIWDTNLTDAEIAILGKGYSPLFVRPQNLVWYLPLIDTSYVELIGGQSFVEGGAPADIPHPRIIYPSLAQIRRFGVALAPSAKGIFMTTNKFFSS